MVRTCVGRGGCVQVGEREEAEHGLFVRGTVRPILNGRAFFGLLPEGGNGGVKGKAVCLSVCLSVCRADRRRRIDRMWRARGWGHDGGFFRQESLRTFRGDAACPAIAFSWTSGNGRIPSFRAGSL